MHVRIVFADMPKTTHSTEYLLESLVEGESLDGVLTSLIVIAERKAQSKYSNKVTANQWSRAARRLKELREWCARLGTPTADDELALMGAATCFELLQEIDRELPEHKTASPLGKALAAAFVADVAARADRPRSG